MNMSVHIGVFGHTTRHLVSKHHEVCFDCFSLKFASIVVCFDCFRSGSVGKWSRSLGAMGFRAQR